jgi:hypothetical protein
MRRFLDYFAIFLARIPGIFVNNPPPKLAKTLRSSLRGMNKRHVTVATVSARVTTERVSHIKSFAALRDGVLGQ